MTNNSEDIQESVDISGQRFRTVTAFKLCSTVSVEGSKPEVLSQIAQAIAVLTRLKPIWNDSNFYIFHSRMRLIYSFVNSVFLYACETQVLTAKLEKRTQSLATRSYRRVTNVSYWDIIDKEEVRMTQCKNWSI